MAVTSITEHALHCRCKRSRVTAEEVIHNGFQDHLMKHRRGACDETQNQL